MANQVIGLCERLESTTSLPLSWDHKILTPTPIAKGWPTALAAIPSLHLAKQSSPLIAPPFPKLAIGCGRMMIPLLLHLRRSGVKTVYLQDPRIDPGKFDLVIAPDHDPVQGNNVIKTIGSVHRVTQARLAAEVPTIHAARLSSLPSPKLAVLIGGDNKYLSLTTDRARAISRRLVNLSTQYGYSLMITASRRTTPDALSVLRAELSALKNCFFWDGTGANPYFDMLKSADGVIVTEDSVNMASEAAATGKPVYRCALVRKRRFGGFLPPKARIKFDNFHHALDAYGASRPLPESGPLDQWNYQPLDPAEAAISAITAILSSN